MTGLLDLAGELLCLILEHVEPNDIDNFLLSCKTLHGIASKEFVNNHRSLKRRLTKIDNWVAQPTWCTTPELLELVLDETCKADYVKAMVVRPWRVEWEPAPHPRHWFPGQTPRSWYPYSKKTMRAFEDDIDDTKSITSEEKNLWIRHMRAGDEAPIIALIFLRLHHLTSLVIVLSNLGDPFMLQTLQRITRNPHSLSLSRLRHVEIRRICRSCFHSPYDVQYLLACTALPSVVSVEGYNLIEPFLENDHEDSSNDEESFLENHHEESSNDEESSGALSVPKTKEDAIELAPRTSSLQHLKLEGCGLRRDTLRELIRSARSLRSFTYTHVSGRSHDIDPSHAWVHGVLLESASTTLEKLVLDYYPFWGCVIALGMQLDFTNFIHLRTLTIEYSSLIGRKFRAPDKIPSLLPLSLETLVLRHCQVESYGWLPQIVTRMTRAKSNVLPRLTELKFAELVLKEPLPFISYVIPEVWAIGARAGIRTTVLFYGHEGGRPFYG